MKKYLSILLSIVILLSITACNVNPNQLHNNLTPTDKPIQPTNNANISVNNYYDEFVNYLLNSDAYQNENFIASPTSIRAALCLAIAGAEDDTLLELLHGSGFNSKSEAENWYKGLLEQVAYFTKEAEKQQKISNSEEITNSFDIANSIWNNDTISAGFKQNYIKYIREIYNADVDSAEGIELTNKINAWVNEKTRGMILSIIDDASPYAALLVNAIYLKAGWINAFNKNNTHDDIFNCKNGSKVTKTYLEDLDSYYKYYADSSTRLVLIPMTGDTYFVCVLGDVTNITDKIMNAKDQRIHLVMPKLDIESTFNNEIIDFLKLRGISSAFTANANFNSMCISENWYIDNIIQKAKIKSDEDGLEAAAVTAITMGCTSIGEPDTNEIIDFIANEAFTFFIYSGIDANTPEMLFCGQVIN